MDARRADPVFFENDLGGAPADHPWSQGLSEVHFIGRRIPRDQPAQFPFTDSKPASKTSLSPPKRDTARLDPILNGPSWPKFERSFITGSLPSNDENVPGLRLGLRGPFRLAPAAPALARRVKGLRQVLKTCLRRPARRTCLRAAASAKAGKFFGRRERLRAGRRKT
jgi:hypothetical protein